MSTKMTIRYQEGKYHLYEELFEEDKVYLSLEGMHATLAAEQGKRSHLLIEFPRETAVSLGLIAEHEGVKE